MGKLPVGMKIVLYSIKLYQTVLCIYTPLMFPIIVYIPLEIHYHSMSTGNYLTASSVTLDVQHG